MTLPDESLDARLRSLYAGLDTSGGFDERVMARVRAERGNLAGARAAQARAEASKRYESTKLRQSWGAWIRRALTLDALGVVTLAAFIVRAVWTGIEARAAGAPPAYALQAVTLFGVLLALATLPVLLLQRRRRSPELA